MAPSINTSSCCASASGFGLPAATTRPCRESCRRCARAGSHPDHMVWIAGLAGRSCRTRVLGCQNRGTDPRRDLVSAIAVFPVGAWQQPAPSNLQDQAGIEHLGTVQGRAASPIPGCNRRGEVPGLTADRIIEGQGVREQLQRVFQIVGPLRLQLRVEAVVQDRRAQCGHVHA